MNIEELLGDALYQLNVLIWALHRDAATPVQPFLNDAGFELVGIGRPLALPPELRARLASDGLSHSHPVVPELLIRTTGQEYVLIECKRSMFGADHQEGQGDSQIRQARSLLLQVEPVLAGALSLRATAISSSQLLYLCRRNTTIDQAAGVGDLRSDLQRRGYHVVPVAVAGIEFDGNVIRLVRSSPATRLTNSLDRMLDSPIVLQEVEADVDPRPLYYIPWSPEADNGGDDYTQAEFGSRILSAAVAEIGPIQPPSAVDLDVEALLRSATSLLYDEWYDPEVKRHLRDKARKLLQTELLRAAPQLPITALTDGRRGFSISVADDAVKDSIVEGLRRWQANRWTTAPQPSLFPEPEETPTGS